MEKEYNASSLATAHTLFTIVKIFYFVNFGRQPTFTEKQPTRITVNAARIAAAGEIIYCIDCMMTVRYLYVQDEAPRARRDVFGHSPTGQQVCAASNRQAARTGA